MNTSLLFDFNVNKETKTVVVTREFEAPLSLVWDAFTKKEILDQWWAPHPAKSETKIMEFKEGGRRFYAMVMPDGTKRWSVQKYKSITPKSNFKFFNAFTDENENPDQYGSDWDLNFSEENGTTRVRISIYNESLERMEAILEGFKMGFTATTNQLEKLLAELKK